MRDHLSLLQSLIPNFMIQVKVTSDPNTAASGLLVSMREDGGGTVSIASISILVT